MLRESAQHGGRFEQQHGGKFLGERVVSGEGRLRVVDRYYLGNIGMGRPHQGLRGEESIVRLIRGNEQPTSTILAIPPDLYVDISVVGIDGQVSRVGNEDVNYFYVPRDADVVYGTIGPTAFVMNEGRRILFGGNITHGPTARSVGMHGEFDVTTLTHEYPDQEWKKTGILAALLPE